MIAQLKWTQSNAKKHRIITFHNWSNDQQRIKNNRTSALEQTEAQATGGGGGGAQMHFTGTNPQVLLLLNTNSVKLRWRLPNYCNVSS